MSKLSAERPIIEITNGNDLNWKRISFRDIVDAHPYNIKDKCTDTVSDWDGVWRWGSYGEDSYKNDPNISCIFKQVIERSEELHIVTARTKSRSISFFPFISDYQIEEMNDHVRTINSSCKLFFVCGPEKFFNGNIVGEIIRRKVDQEHHVGVFGSSRRDKSFHEKIHSDLGENKSRVTIFDTGHMII